ncbi:MAG TPA: hypothetical protein VN418_09100 [Gammaproteobacteria bacterium]|nr:hypothetical protein [Gammaproteobacteria bacterium]
MLHYLRQRRHTLARSVLALLAMVWLSVALQPCVMAAGAAAIESDMCPECMQQKADAGQTDCQPGISCAVSRHVQDSDQAGFAHPLFLPPAPPARIGISPVLNIDSLPPAALPEHANPPILSRFCILQV